MKLNHALEGVEQDFSYGIYCPRQMRLFHIRTYPDHFVRASTQFVDLFRLNFFQRMASPHPIGRKYFILDAHLHILILCILNFYVCVLR